MSKRTGTDGEGGAAKADGTCRCPRAMHMRDDSCHANVARATDYYQSMGGTYLTCASQSGRAASCELAQPCACHSGTEESMMFYARRTMQDLTACVHSLSAYTLSVPKAKMAARLPPTPPPRVTATGVNSPGPIGRAQTGIGLLARMGYDWAYLKRALTQWQSQSSERIGHAVT